MIGFNFKKIIIRVGGFFALLLVLLPLAGNSSCFLRVNNIIIKKKTQHYPENIDLSANYNEAYKHLISLKNKKGQVPAPAAISFFERFIAPNLSNQYISNLSKVELSNNWLWFTRVKFRGELPFFTYRFWFPSGPRVLIKANDFIEITDFYNDISKELLNFKMKHTSLPITKDSILPDRYAHKQATSLIEGLNLHYKVLSNISKINDDDFIFFKKDHFVADHFLNFITSILRIFWTGKMPALTKEQLEQHLKDGHLDKLYSTFYKYYKRKWFIEQTGRGIAVTFIYLYAIDVWNYAHYILEKFDTEARPLIDTISLANEDAKRLPQKTKDIISKLSSYTSFEVMILARIRKIEKLRKINPSSDSILNQKKKIDKAYLGMEQIKDYLVEEYEIYNIEKALKHYLGRETDKANQ